MKRKTKSTPARKTEKHSPNTKWLLALIESKGITQASLSSETGIARPALSRAFSGKRRFKLGEATKIASVLNVPLEELFSGLGMELGSPESAQYIEVDGWLDGSLILRAVGEAGGLKGSKTAPCPFPDRDIRVARVQSAGSEFDGLDGTLVYYRETRDARGVSSEAIGRLAIVKIVGLKEMRLRVIRRGYTSGKYNLSSMAGKLIEESVAVESVFPIVWMKL